MTHIFLLDIDGVLIDAIGYCKALQDTVAHFSRAMGLGDHAPTPQEIQCFEANGLTSEWDSGALCVGALLLGRLRADPALPLPSQWQIAVRRLAAQPLRIASPAFCDLARRVGQAGGNESSPSEAALRVLGEEARQICGLEVTRPTVETLLQFLLGNTHDVARAPVTRHFQHLVIGSQAMQETYSLAPDFESEAYLKAYDRVHLFDAARNRMHRAIMDGRLRAALYTLRPSLPPVDAHVSSTGYSPEAEMARSQAGLDYLPLIGLGRMQWLAMHSGATLKSLIKPSPVQALAAIGAAWSGQEVLALQAAMQLVRDGTLDSPLSELNDLTLHVMEDSPGGLGAVQRAGEMLQAVGVRCEWHLYGITSSTSPKAEIMMSKGVSIYPSVNEAVDTALARI